MTELEKEATRYSEENCDQVESVNLIMLREYAKADFIAGAEWYKEKLKFVEMLAMLEEVWEAFDNGWDDQLNLQKIKKLIVESKKL